MNTAREEYAAALRHLQAAAKVATPEELWNMSVDLLERAKALRKAHSGILRAPHGGTFNSGRGVPFILGADGRQTFFTGVDRFYVVDGQRVAEGDIIGEALR